jgi:hypothetical protein
VRKQSVGLLEPARRHEHRRQGEEAKIDRRHSNVRVVTSSRFISTNGPADIKVVHLRIEMETGAARGPEIEVQASTRVEHAPQVFGRVDECRCG